MVECRAAYIQCEISLLNYIQCAYLERTSCDTARREKGAHIRITRRSKCREH